MRGAGNAQAHSPIDWSTRLRQLAQQARDPQLRGFYAAGTVPWDTPLERVELLAMDVETTGLNPRTDSIVSIGLLPFTLQRIRCGQALYWVVKPTSGLLAKSVTFHHITHTDIRHAPGLDEVLPQLLQAMAGKVLVVHYRAIERGFLDQAFQRLRGEGLQFPVIDTMQIEARLHRRKRGWLSRWLGRPEASIRLADSRTRYNLPQYQAHHALTDALATAELLQAQIARHYLADIAIAQLWE